LLPIKTDSGNNPVIDSTHQYHEQGFVPDFDYMQHRIEELEQNRIEELERYLVATGLNDYELTAEDIQILSLSGFRSEEESDCANASGLHKEMREFAWDTLFELQTVQHKLKKMDLVNKGKYPAYSSDSSNSGIIGYTDKVEFICDADNPYYLVFGDHTITFNIATTSFSVLDNVKVLKSKVHSTKVLLYIISIWKKQIPYLGYKRHWSIAQDCKLNLPIQTTPDNTPIIDTSNTYHPEGFIPDWDFMEKYIRAIEKEVIRGVVDYKDAMIAKTKQVVANSEKATA
jgi:hypothetical protein